MKKKPNIIERAMDNVDATIQKFVTTMETSGPSPAERSRKMQERIERRMFKK